MGIPKSVYFDYRFLPRNTTNNLIKYFKKLKSVFLGKTFLPKNATYNLIKYIKTLESFLQVTDFYLEIPPTIPV